MNLGPPAGTPTNQRPHQQGRALGIKAGGPVWVGVEWMIDTGADIGVVRQTIGNSFDLTPTGASASPTTGGGGILVKTGLEAEFTAENAAGAPRRLRTSQAVGVKSSNAGKDIIGMDQLASVNVTVDWNPATLAGSLKV